MAADPSVSPADTLAALLAEALTRGSDLIGITPDLAAVLLAVGERDKAALADAAVVLEVLAGQIRVKPYRELTADFQAQITDAAETARDALLTDGASLTSERERDRRQIAQLTEALRQVGDGEITNLCWCGDEWVGLQDGEPFDDDFKHSEWCLRARAVLAGEEDAGNG